MAGLISALGNSSRAFFQAVLKTPPRLSLVPSGRLARLTALLSLFDRSDEASETLLAEKFSELRIQGDLDEYESRALDRLKDLMALRRLVFGGRAHRPKDRLRQGFLSRAASEQTDEPSPVLTDFSVQDITQNANVVAELHWKLYDSCLGAIPELRPVAARLYFLMFGEAFEAKAASLRVSALVDAIQRDRGVPYLVLNFLRQGDLAQARALTRGLVEQAVELDAEETTTALYWLAETLWFQKTYSAEPLSHETSLRFLYHLCFTQPERAAFLEIDSAFYDEFEAVNELAREAFTYRETLVSTWLDLWATYEGGFDLLFQRALERVVGRPSKIHDHRNGWENLWKRSAESFSRDYLYLVEGNLCYASGLYHEAIECYEAALDCNPELRPAQMNLLFAHAKLRDPGVLGALAQGLAGSKRADAPVLSTLANAYLVLGDVSTACTYLDRVRAIPGWASRIDYYVSTFCFQHGLTELALEFALAAREHAPSEPSVLYHLAICFDAMGQKEKALEVVNALPPASELAWLKFYRFTLERDLGNDQAASETLRRIPVDYFEDPEELEAALRFAKGKSDLELMRQLRALVFSAGKSR